VDSVDVATEVGVFVGVGDASESVGMGVAVKGTGDGSTLLVAVGTAFGTNSTSEMERAPMINPIEISATINALLKSRPGRII
jgi:hypothetical protein